MICQTNKNQGLTLIEVLIALAIVGIAMTAIIKTTSQNIRSTAYLQNKTIAMWVGLQVLSEARVGLRRLNNESDQVMETTLMLGQEWVWRAGQTETPNKRIKKMHVDVLSSKREDAVPLIHLESYLYVAS